MAPVLIGIAAPDEDEDEDPDPAPPAGVGAMPTLPVGDGTPEVRGLSLALVAPAKATDWVEAVATGFAEVLLGFKTLEVVSAPWIV